MAHWEKQTSCIYYVNKPSSKSYRVSGDLSKGMMAHHSELRKITFKYVLNIFLRRKKSLHNESSRKNHFMESDGQTLNVGIAKFVFVLAITN